jgi:hypothetical protein
MFQGSFRQSCPVCATKDSYLEVHPPRCRGLSPRSPYQHQLIRSMCVWVAWIEVVLDLEFLGILALDGQAARGATRLQSSSGTWPLAWNWDVPDGGGSTRHLRSVVTRGSLVQRETLEGLNRYDLRSTCGTRFKKVGTAEKKSTVPDVVPKTGLEPVHPCGR